MQVIFTGVRVHRNGLKYPEEQEHVNIGLPNDQLKKSKI
jgi:hypothetical protein